jgi:hypothetical protein
MIDNLICMTMIPLLQLGWLIVQSIARRFAQSHPEIGPPREEGAGCGKREAWGQVLPFALLILP